MHSYFQTKVRESLIKMAKTGSIVTPNSLASDSKLQSMITSTMQSVVVERRSGRRTGEKCLARLRENVNNDTKATPLQNRNVDYNNDV